MLKKKENVMDIKKKKRKSNDNISKVCIRLLVNFGLDELMMRVLNVTTMDEQA